MSNTDPANNHDDSFPLTGDTNEESVPTPPSPTGDDNSAADPGGDTELQKLQQELSEMTATAQRALADLQNYKRRAEEEKQAFVAFASAQVFTELLPSLQNMERALQHLPQEGSGDSNQETITNWTQGASQTMRQLLQSCEKLGLKPIPTVGEPFDPDRHEALLTAPGPKDQVIEELEKGYLLGDRVLKPARVKVGSGEKQ